jgi:AraC-like DNA-binding protein
MATRKQKKPRIFTDSDRQRFQRVAELYLEQCRREQTPVRGTGFARMLEVTPEYASSLAPRLLGVQLMDWLRARQVEYAAKLLRRNPLSVEDIAIRAGFGSVRTFQRAFLKVKGVTPTEFRKLGK